MGVPKFYRWISERYPCLSEVIKEYQMPEFDNLYLDMNGIIHVCSHPNDDDPHFRISEEKIFADIFHYIEVLFRIIKPQKVFFMAVDGVAPRAKMNQQRGRRFRSAREAKKLEEEALRKGEVLPDEKRFDSNCITPGTEFMVRLQDQLKFFVQTKISTDKLWQGLRIFLSGHETPGEGEHKIMDFIRHEKSNPGYNPNTRHCLYGLDADLIMLGLCSHEPHFSLLREEVRFGSKKSQKRVTTAEQTTFHLLHLSLMREYLDLEFKSLQPLLNFEYNIENIIDDWVLMGFLVGNDFIPHLPNLHIAQDALPTLYNAYKQVLPTLDGYLNEGGILNLKRFEAYMEQLSKVDHDKFDEQYGDLKWLEGKSAPSKEEKSQSKLNGGGSMFDALASLGSDMDSMLLEDLSDEENADELGASIKHSVSISSSLESLDDEQMFQLEFQTMKRNYYISKLHYECITTDVMETLALEYVRAIQWNLHYYYNGVASWSWFYPYHYSPFISDIKNFSEKKLEYEYSCPFLPFQQLLGVLPSLSKDLLPEAYQSLMCSAESPLIEFYPNDFKTDLNCKTHDWEAVVLIPFIDEKRMIAAMEVYESNLRPSEKKRNQHGPCLLYTYSPEQSGMCKSSLPSYFPDIPFNHAVLTEIDKDLHRLKPDEIKKGLCDNVNKDIYFYGFPTLKYVPHTASLKKAAVTVFHMASRKESMILDVSHDEPLKPADLARELLGKTVYVAWPHIVEAKVSAISTPTSKFTLNPAKETGLEVQNYTESDKRLFKAQRSDVIKRHMTRLGIALQNSDVLVFAQPMTGRKYICTSSGRVTLEKQFSAVPQPYPIQTLIKNVDVFSSDSKPYKSVEEMFPPKTTIFMLAHPNYGCQAEVLSVEKTAKCMVKAKIMVPTQPDIESVKQQQKHFVSHYMPTFVLAQKLGLSNHFVSRITGTMLIIPMHKKNCVDSSATNKINIGLNLKFSKKNEQVPGYTKKSLDGNWLYSYKTLDTIQDYLEKFPDLFDYISNRTGSDIYFIDEVFPGDDGLRKLEEVQSYLKGLPCTNIERQACGSELLDAGIIKQIENVVDKTVAESKQIKCITAAIRPKHLFKPNSNALMVAPDESATFQLFDRIVNIREGYNVPLSLRGTIIGLHEGETKRDCIYDVVFDRPFTGGLTIQCSPLRAYKMPANAMINLSYGQRKSNASQAANDQPTSRAAESSNTRRKTTYAEATGDGPAKSDKLGRINHSPTSPFQPQNNLKFITPKMPVETKQTPKNSKMISKQQKNSYPSDEFKNIWNYLRENIDGSTPKESASSNAKEEKRVSLEHAAKSLPKFSAQKMPGGKNDIIPSDHVEQQKKAFSQDHSAMLRKFLNIDPDKMKEVEQKSTPKSPGKHGDVKNASGATDHKSHLQTNPQQLVQEVKKTSNENMPVAPGSNQQKRSRAVTQLMQLSQSLYHGVPTYKFIKLADKVSAELTLPNNSKFCGVGHNQEVAAEMVAAQALAFCHQNKQSRSNVPLQNAHPMADNFIKQISARNMVPPPFRSDPMLVNNYRPGPVGPMQRPPVPHPMMYQQYQAPRFNQDLMNQAAFNNIMGYTRWSQGPDLTRPEMLGHQPQLVRPQQIVNNNMSPTVKQVLSPHSNPFIPLQVTKHKTKPRTTSETNYEDVKPATEKQIEQQPSGNAAAVVAPSGQQSASKKQQTSRMRLACTFSNAPQ